MEIVEKVKEIPAQDYWDKYDGYSRRNVNNKANAGLALGIVGTTLGALSLFGRHHGVLGGANSGLGAANININGSTGLGNGVPTTFDVQMKECEDVLALQGGLYNWALTQQNQRFQDRQTLNGELFGIYKSQIDADFGLYKSTRDNFNALTAKHNEDSFNLYKSQRDADDSIRKELSDLRMQVAVNAAIRPYQDKLIQCEIDKAFTAGINYTDRKTCNVIYGQVVLPNTPTVTGFGSVSGCGCCPNTSSSTPAA